LTTFVEKTFFLFEPNGMQSITIQISATKEIHLQQTILVRYTQYVEVWYGFAWKPKYLHVRILMLRSENGGSRCINFIQHALKGCLLRAGDVGKENITVRRRE